MTRGPNFLLALLRRGAPVLASTPRELPSEVDDPAPVAAVRRMGAMAASEVEPPADPLMIRATRYAVLLPMTFRIVGLPAVWLWLVLGFGPTWQQTVVAWFGTVFTAASAGWVLRVPDRRGRWTWALLWTDVALAVGASLWCGATAPAELFWPGGWLPFIYLTSTVALWTMCRGLFAGLGLAVLGIGLQGVLLWLGPGGGRPALASLAGVAGMLLVAVATAVGSLVLLGLATRLALAIGMRLGQDAERARTERTLHDTVLQTLEAIALADGGATELARVREAARVQATELRRMLNSTGAPDGLAAELATLATEMAREGLRAELAISDIGDDQLSEARRIAVRDAAREALRNTMKHAGTREVVVRMEERDGGVVVVTRDHGVGYDADARPAGFGMSESMKARLSEVGGWCRVESRPGRGTRVTMWVPR
ncbi:signal transduction histidine kinase [Amycolatopsis bartoniae]|uniref:Histidine kinase n=1 Tax=Amycolatopsis bartoniae TaxID=941986 RepID=A0A8H9IZZ9_9PSEU|nr:ATP-binding protein [Amycolatopsis bartoniae]MBB2934047.1 signal transduction histidine kinase [Amycolatopsis bartoniae]TVT07340.1 ATP-binding protein [Amycolatopsis bartoniae]GHF84717.1 histidine kinase [Amycolatopsis bartoniae]